MITILKRFLFIKLRIWKYNFLSDCKNVIGKPNLYVPLLLNGKGKIQFGNNVQNGVTAAHFTYSTYNYIFAMEEDTEVIIGNNVVLANGATIQAASKITIENNLCLS